MISSHSPVYSEEIQYPAEHLTVLGRNGDDGLIRSACFCNQYDRAILMASGRVPNTVITLIIIKTSL